MELADLAAAVPGATVTGDQLGLEITSIEFDSRAVRSGSLFCCLRGEHTDGHEHAADAVAAGAVALLVDHSLDQAVPQVVVGDTRPAMAHLAVRFNGDPASAMTVIGITGTNGKTTTTYLLRNIFEAAGRSAEVVGTLSGTRTTPEAPELQARLGAVRDRGVEMVAMEVSSHALAMHRVDGTRFAVAVFTNLSRDHLDFHETMESYFEAKARLFRPELAARAVVDVDGPYGRLLLDAAEIPTTGYSLDDAEDLEVSTVGSIFRWRGHPVTLGLGGRFNVANALAAAEAAVAVGLDPAVVAEGLSRPIVVPGRFEVVEAGQPFQVVIDYAHTPDGLEQLLSAVRGTGVAGTVTVVFGCGGDRDATKRPAMGEVAARLADRVVLTSDNSRGEETGAIIDAVRQGYEHTTDRRDQDLLVEPDRRGAIAAALREAAPGDVVVIAGKGHETTQTIGDTVVPFDDREVAREEIARLGETRRVIRLLVAAGIALAVSIVGTRFLIDWLTRHRVGQPIREDGPAGHKTKAGTPTMGGIAIVIAAAAGWVFSDLFDGTFTRRGILVMGALIGAGIVGLIDDWLKVSRERNLGLNKRAKMIGLLIVSVGFAVGALVFTNVATTLSFTRFDLPGVEIGKLVWAIWAVLVILAIANAVNLTDGLDGLAAGSAIFGFAAFVVIGFWGFRHPLVYGDQSFLDLAIVAAAMLGSCTGFLWWNAAPAKIFMGDTGSLAIGTALACLALSTNTSLLLPLICGLNVMETVSVILQVGSFQLTGRRIFRMAPVHHHFELGGWPETTVIIRFWILAGLCTALALGLYYADFVGLGVVD